MIRSAWNYNHVPCIGLKANQSNWNRHGPHVRSACRSIRAWSKPGITRCRSKTSPGTSSGGGRLRFLETELGFHNSGQPNHRRGAGQPPQKKSWLPFGFPLSQPQKGYPENKQARFVSQSHLSILWMNIHLPPDVHQDRVLTHSM